MTKKELHGMIQKIVRNEIERAFNKYFLVNTPSQVPIKNEGVYKEKIQSFKEELPAFEKRVFSQNPAINNILNETAMSIHDDDITASNAPLEDPAEASIGVYKDYSKILNGIDKHRKSRRGM